MSEQQRTQPDSEKDQYPPDADFGRQAARDAERLEKLQEHGATPVTLPDTASDDQTDAPRPASKAEPPSPDRATTPRESSSTASDDVDEASEDSFPASDPPSSTASSAS